MAALAEAVDHMKAAKKAMKTSPWTFKFNPDTDLAAAEFGYAAKAYQRAGKYQEAIAAFKQSGTLRGSLCDFFGAGRQFEAAASIAETNTKDINTALELWESAVQMYVHATKTEAAAKLVLKSATAYEEILNEVDRSKIAYLRCLDIYDEAPDRDMTHSAVEVCRTFTDFLARHEKYDEALEALKKQMTYHHKLKQYPSMAKCVLAQVVLSLYKDDPIGGERCIAVALSKEASLIDAREVGVASTAIQAYQAGDAPALKKLMSTQLVTYIPVEFAKLAKLVDLPAAMKQAGDGNHSGLSDVGVAELLL
eukprot:Lankesteria_metandrocarpae@DN4456_c0_g1_i1.p1